MAIVVEEKKNQVGIITILIWLLILGVIAAAVYYIFFEKPALVEISAPANFRNTQQLSKIKLNPEEVVNSPVFQMLKQYVTTAVPQNVGRSNPFISF